MGVGGGGRRENGHVQHSAVPVYVSDPKRRTYRAHSSFGTQVNGERAEPQVRGGQLVDPAAGGPRGAQVPGGTAGRPARRGGRGGSARDASAREAPGPHPPRRGWRGTPRTRPGGTRVPPAPPAPHGPPRARGPRGRRGRPCDSTPPASRSATGPPHLPPSQPVGEAHGGVGRGRGAPSPGAVGGAARGAPHPSTLVSPPPFSSGGTARLPPAGRTARAGAGPGTCAPRPAAAPVARDDGTAGSRPRVVAPRTPPARGARCAGGSPESEGGRDGRKEGNGHAERPPGPRRRHRHRHHRRGGGGGGGVDGASDKPLCRGLTFNRSQRGSCSATYETPTQKQVVYEWFSTRFPTNVRCVTGEGAAAFPAAPRVPGRRALRTGPRSRRAAGRAAPRPGGRGRRPAGGDGGGPAIRGQPRLPRRCRIVPPGRDSDLEAFSHNPTDGSFAPLAPQPSTYTKCLNLRFLSY